MNYYSSPLKGIYTTVVKCQFCFLQHNCSMGNNQDHEADCIATDTLNCASLHPSGLRPIFVTMSY
ncbi:hypothetical protein FRX31_007517 [Thalictrum thalictroides]|uniref:Uncharacterized protein n=1 Tax=Thalictrum thalictroides TaxID=46969 RepID=A0A7J6X1G8_THATH|nr:hypothetical protein FRX31_007517 [Thalictrum thalictroides]